MEQSTTFSQYTTKTVQEIAQSLHSSLDSGLHSSQIASLKNSFGLNEIRGHSTSWYDLLLRQVTSPFIYLLLAVAIFSFFLQNKVDFWVILVVVIVNTLFGFYQEFKANKALLFLQQFISSKITVIRNGQAQEILTKELVPGDLIELSAGDIIPADIRFVDTQNVRVDESTITGEAQPIEKISDRLQQEEKELFKAHNIGFSGTTLNSGKARGIVIATGMNTVFGSIASLATQTVKKSSFEKGIDEFSNFILRLMGISLVIIFCANLIIKGGHVDIIQLIVFSCALAVSVIPEAFPIVTTFALSQGALRLAHHKTVVKRLSAIEDLGNIEVLCTDKTGTLTENKLTVVELFGPDTAQLLIYNGFFIHQTEHLKGFDAAVHDYMSQQSISLPSFTVLKNVPFDPTNKREILIIEKDGVKELIIRSSLEEIFNRSSLNATQKNFVQHWASEQGNLGYRVLGVGRKKITTVTDTPDENNIEIMGLISFTDPLKKTASIAIQKAAQLKIIIKILSGDAPEVCGAIAQQVGLIEDSSQVITGYDFEKKSENEQSEIVEKYAVFARVSPDQKYKIIQLLQKKYDVGYMGDGINDAPALKIANVAIAVQDASDIARQVSDIILLKKSLLVIVEGIEQGRKVFANTLKYIRTTLTSTFGNFYSVALVSLFIDYLPLLPVQLLLINVLSDFPMLSIATDNVKLSELKRPAKYDIRSIIIMATTLGLVCTMFDFIFFGVFHTLKPAVVQTSWFIFNIVTAILFIFSIRTTRVFFKGSLPSLPLILLSLLIIGVAVFLPTTSFGHNYFYFVPLNYSYIFKIFCIAAAYFITTDGIKLLFYHIYNNKK